MSTQGLCVLFAGGGTAGHVLPAIATDDALRKLTRSSGLPITSIYLATEHGAELPILRERGANFHLVPKCDFPRKFNVDILTFLPRLIFAVARALRAVRGVDVVIGFGGYVALPAYFAARIASKPLIIHEANALPGLANRVGKKFATYAFTNFPIPAWPTSEPIGLPIRESIWQVGRMSDQERNEARIRARKHFGLESERKTILAFGGSLGAAKLNEALANSLPLLLDSGFQILHATGAGKEAAISQSGYHPMPFITEMDQAYLAADLIISRSGAGSCAEILATGIPALLIPLEIGNGEQRLNAEFLAQSGVAKVILNDQLSSESLIASIKELVDYPVSSTITESPAAERLALAIMDIHGLREKKR